MHSGYAWAFLQRMSFLWLAEKPWFNKFSALSLKLYANCSFTSATCDNINHISRNFLLGSRVKITGYLMIGRVCLPKSHGGLSTSVAKLGLLVKIANF